LSTLPQRNDILVNTYVAAHETARYAEIIGIKTGKARGRCRIKSRYNNVYTLFNQMLVVIMVLVH